MSTLILYYILFHAIISLSISIILLFTHSASVRIIFKWYDIWIGIFIDTKKKRIYHFPLPMIGVVYEFD